MTVANVLNTVSLKLDRNFGLYHDMTVANVLITVSLQLDHKFGLYFDMSVEMSLSLSLYN